MKFLPFILLMTSSCALANPSSVDQARHQALLFNKWYIQQISQNKYPLTNSKEIEKFVTRDTLKKLHDADGKEDEDYGSDFFLKAQDYEQEWPDNVSVIQSDYDPVCTNVYIAFGKEKKHIVVDCMVKEAGAWKIQSVAGTEIMPN